MTVQSDVVAAQSAKAAYEPPVLVEYGQASNLIETAPSGTNNGDGGAAGSDYSS